MKEALGIKTGCRIFTENDFGSLQTSILSSLSWQYVGSCCYGSAKLTLTFFSVGSGTGLMCQCIDFVEGVLTHSPLIDINNVGSISQALYAKTHAVYDDVEASKWQAAQVSILSLGNFAGRVLIGEVCASLTCLILTNCIPGIISDFAHTRLRLPRAYCLCIVSSLFIISQATAIIVSSVETLWVATLLLGLAYGSLFGSCPTIIIEWFGLGKSHFCI